MEPDPKRLGDMLIEAKVLTPEDLDLAIAEQQRTGKKLGATLVAMGFVSENVLLQYLRAQVGLEEETRSIDEVGKEAEGQPIVRLTDSLLHSAIEERATDVHIEPQGRDLIVRFRVDGLLRETQHLPKSTQNALVSRIKMLASLDTAEKRKPQDGRMMLEVAGRRIELRISTLPVTNGEKVVIGIVDQKRAQFEMADIGMGEDDLTRVKRYLNRPQGIVLVTGPAGSGKTTLLYSALREIQHETRNIVTVEDPVEFQLGGINQVPVDEEAENTFPAALRAILRQDPDVIMIGEIRDAETAQIAFRASATGHLVLGAVHTNDAAGAVTRLLDLGLKPSMVASSLVGVVSMRLVRALCLHCKESYEASASDLGRIGMSSAEGGKVTLFRGAGCSHCQDSGYHGRTGIFEVLEVDEPMRGLILQGASDGAIRQAAVEGGMCSISDDGLRKVREGRTTLEEVARSVYLADQTASVCPSCQMILTHEFDYCPGCGHVVSDHCESCQRRVAPNWEFCPYCGSSNEHSTPQDRGRVISLPRKSSQSSTDRHRKAA